MKPDVESSEVPERVRKLLKEGRWLDAVKELERLLASNPEQVVLWREKANTLMALQSPEEALACYDRVLQLEPGDPLVYEQRAGTLESLGRNDESLVSYRHALTLNPSNIGVLSRMGRLLTRLGKTSEALAVYDQIGRLDPQNPEYLIGHGDTQINAGRIDEAILDFEKAASIDGEAFGAEEWTTRGDDLLDAGRSAAALEFYEKAIEYDPKYAMAYRGKAQVLRQTPEKTDEALQCYDDAIQLDPKNAWFQLNKGNIYYDRKDYPPAVECYKKAIELDPKVTMAWMNLCVVYEALEQNEKALNAAEKTIELDPSSADAWVHKGFCLEKLERPDESVASYHRALELDANSLWANNNMGWMLLQSEKYHESLRYFEKAIEIDPKESTPLINKASSLIKLKLHSQAIDDLNKSLPHVSNKLDILLYIAYIYSDCLFDDAKALECFAECIKIDPNDRHVRGNIAECLIKIGKFAQGRAEAQKVVGQFGSAEREGALSLVILASYALEGDAAGRAAQFEAVLKHFETMALKPKRGENTWNFDGLVNTITSSNMSAESKFLVLTAVDVHLGKLARGSLSFFAGPPRQSHERTVGNPVNDLELGSAMESTSSRR